MRKSEDTIQTLYNSQRDREDSIMDKQLIDISSKLRYARSTSNSNMRLNELESIYRNLGKALDIINIKGVKQGVYKWINL